MATRCVEIQRHQAGMYEWALLFHGQAAGGDAGLSNITDSLASALEILGEAERIVEVRYNGIHMGTYLQAELRDRGAQVAGDMVGRHAELTRS